VSEKTIVEEDLTILQGSTYDHEFDVTSESDGEPYDLTGFAARMQIRDRKTGTTKYYDIDSGSSADISVDTVNKKVKLSVPASVSSGWSFSEGDYDIEIYLGAFVARIIEGVVILDPEVTK